MYIIKLKKALRMSKDVVSEIKKRFEEAKKSDPNFAEIDLSEIKI